MSFLFLTRFALEDEGEILKGINFIFLHLHGDTVVF